MSGLVVVGVDGSPTSFRALVFALTEARWRRTSLDAVTVWDDPLGGGAATLAASAAAAAAHLEAALEWTHADEWGVPVSRRLLRGVRGARWSSFRRMVSCAGCRSERLYRTRKRGKEPHDHVQDSSEVSRWVSSA